MITICLRCNREHLTGALGAGDKITCSCGNTFAVPEQKPFYPKLLRCGSCGGSIDARAARCEYCHGAVRPFDTSRYCSRCYAFLTAEAEFCSFCGVKSIRADEVPGESVLACPRDGTRLKGVPLGVKHGEECAQCGGIWVRRSDFEAIAQAEARPPEGGEKFEREPRRAEFRRETGYLACPECKEQMARQNYKRVSGVIIDFCLKHGVWLDKHELYDIGAFLRGGGLRAAQAFVESEAVRNLAAQSTETDAPPAEAIGLAISDLFSIK